MYTQDFNPVSDSLGLTAIFAVLPVLTLFVLLGGLKLKAQWAALISLGRGDARGDDRLRHAGRPDRPVRAARAPRSASSRSCGSSIMAIWIYNMTVETGHFAVLRRSFGAISEDQRIQAVIIAFCFGALMEALAGFGTPVAITLGDADRRSASGRSRPPRSRSSRTPRRSRSARSRSRS